MHTYLWISLKSVKKKAIYLSPLTIYSMAKFGMANLKGRKEEAQF